VERELTADSIPHLSLAAFTASMTASGLVCKDGVYHALAANYRR
jgi:hypothetical protein